MSMLSALCDRLRERAEELRNLAPDPDTPYLVPSTKETMALAMRSASSEMGNAADTIWELRNKLNDAYDESDKLRDELEQWHKLAAGIKLPEYPITEFKPKDLERENDKLRELVKALDWCTENFDSPGRCENCPLPQSGGLAPECELRMRELGIEA